MHSLPFASKRLPSEIVEEQNTKKNGDLGFTDLTRLHLDLYSRSIIARSTNTEDSSRLIFLSRLARGGWRPRRSPG